MELTLNFYRFKNKSLNLLIMLLSEYEHILKEIKYKKLLKVILKSLKQLVDERVLNDFSSIHSLIKINENDIAIGDKYLIKIFNFKDGIIIKTLYGHLKKVKCLSLLINDKLASGSFDGEIKIWNLSSGLCLQTIKDSQSSIQSILAINKNTLAYGVGNDDYNNIKIFGRNNENDNFSLKLILDGHDDWTIGLIKLNEKHICSASYDGSIKIWDIKYKGSLKTLNGHLSQILCIIKINSNHVVSGSYDKSIKVWDIHSKKCKQTLLGHSGLVCDLANISNDQIVSAGGDCTLKLWDLISGNCVKTFSVQNRKVDMIRIICINKKQIISGSKDTIRIIDLF